MDLAYDIKISPSYLNDVEHARQYISMKMLERLAKYFDVQPYVLLIPQDGEERSISASEYNSELQKIQNEIDTILIKHSMK